MKIKTVSIIGLGALGVMYGDFISQSLGVDSVRIVVNASRKDRYEREGIFCNDKPCQFNYVDEETPMDPADLVIFAVKFGSLASAIRSAKHQIGPNTIILSVMNGITSEDIIAETYGKEKLLYCTVQGMDAMKVGNRATYAHMGSFTFGEKDNSHTEKTRALAEFLDQVGIPYEIPDNMMERLWSKLMLNDGVNQSAAVFETNYGGLQRDGEPRRVMLEAMKEVMEVAHAEGIHMDPSSIDRWMKVLDSLSPEGEPSLRQDTSAGRKTEVELFAGTITRLGRTHGIPTPQNDFLYERILEMEKSFS